MSDTNSEEILDSINRIFQEVEEETGIVEDGAHNSVFEEALKKRGLTLIPARWVRCASWCHIAIWAISGSGRCLQCKGPIVDYNGN